jgi:peptidoglycan/LPS O-acetylase OafA/YrhL
MPSAASTALPAGIRRSETYFPEVESLRGIAICLVFFFHAEAGLGHVLPTSLAVSPAVAFVFAGHTGVSLFFVLSGFLLSLPFLAEAAGGRRVDRRQYFMRRALRILPLYYTAVIVGTVLTARRPADLLHALPYFLFLNSFAGGVTDLPPYSGVWWSLCTEVQFYLLLPLVGTLLRSRPGRWLGLGLLAAYAAAYGAYLARYLHLTPGWAQISLGFSLFGRAPVFLVGILAAWVYRSYGERLRARLAASRWASAGGADGVLLLLLGALGLLLRWAVVSREVWDQPPDHVWHIPEAALWGSILLLLLLAPLRTRLIFTNPVLATLGVLSYSIYMIHAPLCRLSLEALRGAGTGGFVGWNVRTTVVAVVLTALCVGLSRLTYRFIERPFLVRKSRLE